MESQAFKFQRLPNAAELSRLTPTSPTSVTSHDNILRSNYDGFLYPSDTSDIGNAPEFHYDPVRSHAQEWHYANQRQPSPFYSIVVHLSHLILTLSPIIFLMLAFAASSVDGQPLSRKGQVVIEAAKVGPSLFPIVFAAVVGRLMRTYALWKAERGTSLGMLEQLNGSQNLLAAVERVLHLHGPGAWGLLIVALWALSPLGGQSTLRVLTISQASAATEQDVLYFDTDSYENTAFLGASAFAWAWPTVQAIYQACLLAPYKVTSSSTDLWGNVKIPLLQSLPAYDPAVTDDWFVVPKATIYSSLTGVIVSGLTVNATANFTMESAYFNLTCSEPIFINSDTSGSKSPEDVNQEVERFLGPVTFHTNVSAGVFSDQTQGDDLYSRKWSSFMVDTTWNYTDPAQVNDTNINMIFMSQNVDTQVMTGTKCALGYSYVESWVNCDGYDCYVAKMRPSRNTTKPPSNITPFNSGVFQYYAAFIRWFPFATGEQHSGVTSPSDWYIAGSEAPYNAEVIRGTDYSNVTGAHIAERLGTLVNTLWQTTIAQSALVQDPSQNFTADLPQGAIGALETKGSLQFHIDVYKASKVWVVFTILISFILLSCGVSGAVFRYLSTAPDILGYVSTLAKDNPYFHANTGADSLDGLARTRLLRDVQVQIGNVRPSDQKAYIALRTIPEGEDKRRSRINAAKSRFQFLGI